MADTPKDIFTSQPMNGGKAGRIAILTTDGTEDQEFFYPYYRFLESGYTVDVLTPGGKGFKGKNGAGLDKAMPVEGADPSKYDLLYIPGGKAPAALKEEEASVDFVKQYCETGKPVGSICHGPQLLAKADVIDGKSIAAWPECEEEVRDAGAIFKNEACVKDGQFVTGRWPADLPMQVAGMFEMMKSSSTKNKMAA